MINFEIDGQKAQAEAGTMVIQVADQMGIYIPRFCYHKKLSIAANCRMCLVQIGASKKPLPACATPVAEGMKVSTKSQLTRDAQKAVMEFLLINHPLDCPVCDQGGQCELQDLSVGYGYSRSRYDDAKRVVKDKDIGPLVQTVMTRCIQCTRCVRFGQEVAGLSELGVLSRGEHEEIGTYVAQAMESELSGNVIDICPVGALTAKPSRYTSRPWELHQHATLAPHDCVGSHLYAHIYNDKVMKMAPREREALNEVWLSDRDRFSYQGLYSTDRVTQPMIKRQGQWETVEWLTALEFATEKLQKVLTQAGPKQLAGLISPNSSLEEQYLFQQCLRSIGCSNIDHRLQQVDCRDQADWPTTPTLGMPVAEIENLTSILLIGADIQNDQPILGIRLRKAAARGANLMAVHSSGWQQSLPLTAAILTPNKVASLINILKAAGSDHALVKMAEPNAAERAIAEKLLAKPAAIFLGIEALHDTEASLLHLLARLLAEQTQASLGYLPLGANSVGAWSMGCVPHRLPNGVALSTPGLDWQTAFTESLRAYILFGNEPEFDCARPGLALKALQAADCVIVMNAFKTSAMLDYADVILPIAPFTETAGTTINIQGDRQAFTAVVQPLQETRPGWKVLRILGNFLKIDNFEYADLHAVTAELNRSLQSSVANHAAASWSPNAATLPPIVPPLKYLPYLLAYRVDGLVRRAEALQATPHNQAAIVVNAATAAQLKLVADEFAVLKQGQVVVKLPVKVSAQVADHVVSLPLAFTFMQDFDLQQSFEAPHAG